MSIKQLYLIRHGETDFNKKGIIQGRSVDSVLNDLGEKQAQLFFENYQHIQFDKIYTSSLKRTQQSVSSFIEKGVAWEQKSGLDELSWGIYDGRYPSPLIRPGMKRIIKKWERGMYHAKAYQGESPFEVTNRLHKVLLEILDMREERTVLISTHGRSLRLLLCDMFGLPIVKMSEFTHDNLCLYRVDYDYDTEKFAMISQNDTEHLRTLGL